MESNSGKASSMTSDDGKVKCCKTNHYEYNISIDRHNEELHQKPTKVSMEVGDHTGK
jgi:hypothetical protein